MEEISKEYFMNKTSGKVHKTSSCVTSRCIQSMREVLEKFQYM